MPMPGMPAGKPPMGKSPMGKPPMGDEDSSYIDDIMGEDISGEEGLPEDKTSQLQSALSDLGYKISPDKLTQIESILNAPEKKPAGPGAAPGLPGGMGKPPMGGAVPGGMGSDLTMG